MSRRCFMETALIRGGADGLAAKRYIMITGELSVPREHGGSAG